MNTIQHDLLTLGEHVIAPGERRTIELPVTDLYTHTSLKMPVQVVRGKKPGPTLFLSAAIHGDEINGVEIVRRVLDYKGLGSIRGTLIAVPIVNVQGFLAQSRYTPDRRDLNRCFPPLHFTETTFPKYALSYKTLKPRDSLKHLTPLLFLIPI